MPGRRAAGEGLDALRAALDARGGGACPAARGAGGPLRLHVDRSFTIRGAGTVVTGTLWEGVAARGDEVRILPAGTPARIRSVQVHDEPGERAEAGQRVALNLAGVAATRSARGDVIVAAARRGRPASASTSRSTWVTPDARPDGGTRVAVHHGTRETPARLAELGGRYFQLRLEQPLVPARGDRVVIRSLAPPDTLGGGVVLDPDPPRHGPSRDLLARLARLERGEPERRSRRPRRPSHRRRPALAPLTPAALALEARLRAAGHEPPPDADARRARRAARTRPRRPPRPRHAHPPRRARRRRARASPR